MPEQNDEQGLQGVAGGWLYLEHPETGGRCRVSTEPGVAELYASRGWRPAPDVDLVHPAGGTRTAPDGSDELEAALAAGWTRADFDPAGHTVAEVQGHLADAPAAEVERVVEAEKAGKGRKTIITDPPEKE